MTRRQFLQTTGAALAMSASQRSSGQAVSVPETYTYKTAGGCQIKNSMSMALRNPPISRLFFGFMAGR